ncbi:MAG: hypothetical protein AABW50_01800 [Nanoarchaeota archaeon]
MKEYEEAIKRDNKIKNNLSLGLLIVLSLILIVNILNKNLLSVILASTMFIIILIVHQVLKNEAKRKLSNLKRMFKK